MAKRVSGAAKHTHKYILRDGGHHKEYLVYACDFGDCTHYLPAEKAVGRDTVCWRCGDTCKVPRMRAQRYMKRPHCISCTKTYQSKLPKPSSKPVDLKRLETMTIEELMGDDALFETDKKKDH